MSAVLDGTRRSMQQKVLSRHKKVCAFIDNNALYRVLQEGSRIDYRELLNSLVRGRAMSLAKFYCSEFAKDSVLKAGFYAFLEDAGYQVERSKFKGHRSRKRNPALDPILTRSVHTSIVWDMCDLSSNGHDGYDVFVLVSGSKEYAQSVKHVVQRGVEVEVVFFEDFTSFELKDAASSFRELSQFCLLEN